MSLSRSQPYALRRRDAPAFADHVSAHGVHEIGLDVSAARSQHDVVETLRGVLDLPEWCASGWDAVEDAFEELCTAWPVPLVVLVDGVDELMATSPQVGLEVVLRLSELSRAFAVARDQLDVVVVWGDEARG